MELYEVLNAYCSRSSGAVSKEDKRRHSYMLRRLFSSTYPSSASEYQAIVLSFSSLPTNIVTAESVVSVLLSQVLSHISLSMSSKIAKDTDESSKSITKTIITDKIFFVFFITISPLFPQFINLLYYAHIKNARYTISKKHP